MHTPYGGASFVQQMPADLLPSQQHRAASLSDPRRSSVRPLKLPLADKTIASGPGPTVEHAIAVPLESSQLTALEEGAHVLALWSEVVFRFPPRPPLDCQKYGKESRERVRQELSVES